MGKLIHFDVQFSPSVEFVERVPTLMAFHMSCLPFNRGRFDLCPDSCSQLNQVRHLYNDVEARKLMFATLLYL